MKTLRLLTLLAVMGCSSEGLTQDKRECCEDLTVETSIFTVYYSESKQQPITLTYLSKDRPKNVDRGSMNFYKEKDYYTSDNNDYKGNIQNLRNDIKQFDIGLLPVNLNISSLKT